MTSKRRVSIELKDLIGLVFDCKNCSSSFSVQMDNIKSPLPQRCSNCGQEWAAFDARTGELSGTKLQRVFAELRRLQAELETAGGVTFSLEVAPSAIDRD